MDGSYSKLPMLFSSLISCGVIIFCMIIMSGCSGNTDEMQDGYYSAEASQFDEYGWKEFITICVSDHRIVMVEYDAKNESGFVKSWDMDYMRVMNEEDGTYPNEYARVYSESLLNRQKPEYVDAISGATQSHNTFKLLAEATIEQAKAGNRDIVFVDIPAYE